MKMDEQHRLTIPKIVREAVKLEGEYYLVFKGENEFLLQKTRSGRVLGKVKIHTGGRFFIPSSVVDVFENKKVLIYLDGKLNKVGISIFKEDT